MTMIDLPLLWDAFRENVGATLRAIWLMPLWVKGIILFLVTLTNLAAIIAQ